MILSENYKLHKQKKYGVLILVLMDDTLRAIARFGIIIKHSVLILVLMDDTLRAAKTQTLKTSTRVLILVLMDDTLREEKEGLNNLTLAS